MTGCDDLRARIFDAHSGRLLQVLEHHTDYIRGVSFSRDGSIVLTASDDNLVRVFNAKTGALYHAMRGHTNSVYALAFSQCCRNACTVDGDGNAIIWDTIKGTEVRRLVNAGDGSLLFCCAWAPNCKAVLIPRGLTSLAEWDPSSGTLLREFDAGGFVLGCSYTSDGRTMAASMKDGPARVRLWSTESGALLHELGPGSAACLQRPLAFSPDGRSLVTLHGDRCTSLQLLDVASGALTNDDVSSSHTDDITAVSISPDGHVLLTCSRDGSARLLKKGDWSPKNRASRDSDAPSSSPLRCFIFLVPVAPRVVRGALPR